jgi:maltose O-acetyltransferase
VHVRIPHPLQLAARLKSRLDFARQERRIARLRERGMHIGRDVNFPPDLYVDEPYAWLIRIGDSTSFGPECMIVVHEPGPTRAAGVARFGPVALHASCHIGARSIVLPGVEVGPRTVVAANSVVSRSLPPDTVCAGRPARPFSSLEQYLDGHRRRIESSPGFGYASYTIDALTPERRALLVAAVLAGDAYIVGGRSEELRRTGGTLRTPLEGYVPPPPVPAVPRERYD